MPLYEYKCDKCKHEFSHVCVIADRNIVLEESCPECNEFSVYRVYSSAGSISIGILNADKNMEQSGVQSALERIRDNHPDANMRWKG